MHDEHEIQGIGFGHAIEYQHGLHSKMPRTGTVWGGHEYGYAANDKCYQCAGYTRSAVNPKQKNVR